MLDFPRCAPSSGGSHAAIAARECDDFASIHCAGPLPAEKSASLGERAQQVTASAYEGRYRVLDFRKFAIGPAGLSGLVRGGRCTVKPQWARIGGERSSSNDNLMFNPKPLRPIFLKTYDDPSGLFDPRPMNPPEGVPMLPPAFR
jgi:hypothetical protein